MFVNRIFGGFYFFIFLFGHSVVRYLALEPFNGHIKTAEQWTTIRQIRRVVGEDVTSQLISAFVLSGHGLLHHSCSYGAESWSLWSRDTSTEAATLVTCRTQNQIQAVYMDASNSQWACTTVLGSVCAVSRWIQSSTRSEVRQHCWLHQTSHSTKFDDWCFSHAGLLPGIPYLTILSLSLTPIDLKIF